MNQLQPPSNEWLANGTRLLEWLQTVHEIVYPLQNIEGAGGTFVEQQGDTTIIFSESTESDDTSTTSSSSSSTPSSSSQCAGYTGTKTVVQSLVTTVVGTTVTITRTTVEETYVAGRLCTVSSPTEDVVSFCTVACSSSSSQSSSSRSSSSQSSSQSSSSSSGGMNIRYSQCPGGGGGHIVFDAAHDPIAAVVADTDGLCYYRDTTTIESATNPTVNTFSDCASCLCQTVRYSVCAGHSACALAKGLEGTYYIPVSYFASSSSSSQSSSSGTCAPYAPPFIVIDNCCYSKVDVTAFAQYPATLPAFAFRYYANCTECIADPPNVCCTESSSSSSSRSSSSSSSSSGLCVGCPTTISVNSSGWSFPCTDMNDTFTLTKSGSGAACVWAGTGYGITWNGTNWVITSSDDFGGSCQGSSANLGSGPCPTLGTYTLSGGQSVTIS